MLTEQDVEFAPGARLVDRPPDAEAEAIVQTIHRAMVAECRRRVARLVNELYGHRLASARDLRLEIPLAPRLDIELPAKADAGAYAREHAEELYAEIEKTLREALSKHFDTIELRHYAFVFSGKDDYGRTAEAYLREWYPGYRLGWATTFEEMFARIAAELAADRRAGRPVRIAEIVLVTHGYAGGLLIPLTKEDRKKEDAFRRWRREHPNTDPVEYAQERGHFTPEYLAAVQKDQGKATAALRRARKDVLAALDERARITVRGCNFGQSREGLRALRDFFGGQVQTAAPVGYQGFETTYVRPDHPVPELRSEAKAYDFLVRHRYLEAEPGLSDEDKTRIIRKRFGTPALIPAEFFIFGKQAREAGDEALKKRPKSQQSAFAEEVDPYVVTPAEIEGYEPLEVAREQEVTIRDPAPRRGAVWSVVTSKGRADPELDDLSLKELEARARTLQNPYQPAHAPMLVRLYRAWDRQWLRQRRDPNEDPLHGLHEDQKVFPHRKRFEADAALAPAAVRDDAFEKGTLKYRTRGEHERASAEAAGHSAATQVAAAAAPAARAALTERDFDARGRVETLRDGGLRLWNFAVKSAELRPQFKAPLQQLARRISSRRDVILAIEGHTSSSGDEADNEGLAADRARRVFDALVAAGMPAYAMSVTGFGERRPLAVERKGDALIPRNMAQNRRVEVRLVKVTVQPSMPAPGEAPATPPPAPTGKPPSGGAPDVSLPLDAVEFKKNIRIPGSVRKKVGVLQVTVEGRITFQGKIGLRDPSKTLKLTPDEKKKAFEVALQSELGNLRIEGEVQDGKPSQVKVGLDATDWLAIDFAANSDFTRPFQIDVKGKPVDVTFPAGDWAFRGRVYVTVTFYFGPDPKVVGSLVARGGRAILRVVARAGVAAKGLFITEIGAVTTFGAVAIGVGVGAAGVTWIGFVLYKIGEAHQEGRRLSAASEFAWGYGHMLMELTAYDKAVGQLTRRKVEKFVSVDWRAQFGPLTKRWVEKKDRKAFNRLYDLGMAAASQDYNTYVKVYGDDQWNRLVAAHRKRYGEHYAQREERYIWIVRTQIKEEKQTIGVPLEVNP